MKDEITLQIDSGQPISDRRWAIVQEVLSNQQVSVAELSQRFGVSEVSIRRDLVHLEEIGVLQRVHGGAQAIFRTGQTLPFDVRMLQDIELKHAIGQAATSLIRPGNSILLDAGTTVLEVARNLSEALLDEGNLTIVTRSLIIASTLRCHRRVRLVVLGGVYVYDFDTFVGPQVQKALQDLHVDTLFVGIDGVTKRGLTTDNVLEASLYPELARCADRVVVVTDSSKIGVNRLQALLPLSEIHTFITDIDAPDDFVNLLQDQGIEVVLAPIS